MCQQGATSNTSSGESQNKLYAPHNTNALSPTVCSSATQDVSFSTVGGKHQNRSYILPSLQEQEDSSDAVTSMLHVFFLDVYGLLDPRSSFLCDPLVAENYEVSCEEILDPILVFTLFGRVISRQESV